MNDTKPSPYSTEYKIRKYTRLFFNYLLLILLAIFFLFPIVFMLVSSLKNEEMQVLRDMASLFAFMPRGEVGLKNYFDVFEQMPFARFMLNSVCIVGTIVIFGLLVNSLMAYALARLRFKGRNVLLAVIISLIIIPFFINLPKDMEEAALVDGASLFEIYWKIILPLSRPVFATVAILQFLLHWNDFLWPLMVTRGKTYRPLMVAIQQFFSQDPKVWGDIMAFASMITIPVLIVFLLFQKWFVQSVATTGVKG